MAKIEKGQLCPREQNLSLEKNILLRNSKFQKLIYLINHVSTETLTSVWVIISGINSPVAENNCQSKYIYLKKKCCFGNWIFKNVCSPFIEVKLTIYYLLALDYFEALLNIHKDTFILLLKKYWIGRLTDISTVTTNIKFVLWSFISNYE